MPMRHERSTCFEKHLMYSYLLPILLYSYSLRVFIALLIVQYFELQLKIIYNQL